MTLCHWMISDGISIQESLSSWKCKRITPQLVQESEREVQARLHELKSCTVSLLTWISHWWEGWDHHSWIRHSRIRHTVSVFVLRLTESWKCSIEPTARGQAWELRSTPGWEHIRALSITSNHQYCKWWHCRWRRVTADPFGFVSKDMKEVLVCCPSTTYIDIQLFSRPWGCGRSAIYISIMQRNEESHRSSGFVLFFSFFFQSNAPFQFFFHFTKFVISFETKTSRLWISY